MPEPTPTIIPEWTWVNVATNVKSLLVARLKTNVYYYYTYRFYDPVTTTIPPIPTAGTIPDDAVKMFTVNDQLKEFIESDLAIDIYIMCANFDDDFSDNGEIIILQGKSTIDVLPQDHITPAVITKFNKVTNSTTLTAPVSKYSYQINVASTTGMILPATIYDGSYIILFDVGSGRFYTGHIVSILGLAVTLDTQLDFDFPIGTIVDITITNMAVDGSIAPQIFGIRGLGVIPGINREYDFTRILFQCLTDTPVTLAKFGDLPKLLRGVCLRFRNGETYNIFNVKKNLDIAGIMLDWIPYSATNPAQDLDGFTARLTFTRLGIAERLRPGEDLEIIIQDDITGILLLEVILEGHEVR